MNKLLRVFVVLSLILVFFNAENLHAKKKKKKKGKKSQWAYTIIDGAAVYKEANFDAEIVTYLPDNKKYRISRKKVFGITGFGSFFKIKYGKKKYGYISDVDLKLTRKISKSERTIYDIDQKDETDDGMPFFFNRYVGVSYGSINMTEEYQGQTLSSQTPVIGVKLTGPEILLPPPLDYELFFSLEAPKYFDKFASKTTGLFMLAHIATNNPFIIRKSFYMYYGFGISLLFTMFKNTMAAPLGEVENQKIAIGVDFPLGIAFKISEKFNIKAEGKYYIEQQKYFGFMLSGQMRY